MRRRVAAVLVLVLLAAACAPAPAPTLAPDAGGPPVTVHLGPSVEVTPSAVLLTSIGETRTLTATALDGVGKPSGGSATWTSSHPDVVDVAADGTVTAKRVGSAQVIAEIGGIRSPGTIVVVAQPAAGVILVTDDQITGVAPLDAGTYTATLEGVTPKAGDLLVGTGGKTLAGRVRAVDGATVTMELVSLPELFPGFSLNETVDLSTAPIQVPADIAALYDITRTGDTFTFTPKPNFMDLVPRAAAFDDLELVAYRGSSAASERVTTAQATGTYMLPFQECETLLTGVTGNTLPIQLADPPGFTMSINPSLDVAFTPDDHLVHWLVRAAPKATLNASIKINTQVEGKIECKATYFEYRIPIGGWLSFFVSGLVPVGLGFALDGKITVASATVGGKSEAASTAAFGIDCASGSCEFVHQLGDLKWDPKWTFSAPSIANVRIQPSFEVYGFLKAKIGNPVLTYIGIDMATAKIGGTYAADWAPRVSQMADKEYASEYKLTLEAGVSLSEQLGEVAARLGVDSISGTALKISTDLYHSPTAKLSLDKGSYAAGDNGVAKVHFDPPDNLTFLGLAYNVDRVVLLHDTSGGGAPGYEELATATAADNQADFELSFTAHSAISGSDIYAFVVPRYLSPSDELALELEAPKGRTGILYAGNVPATPGIYLYTPADGSSAPLTQGADDRCPRWSPDGTAIAYWKGPELRVMHADGSGDTTIATGESGRGLAWSPDGQRLAFAKSSPAAIFTVERHGSDERRVTDGASIDYWPTWSPDGTEIAFESDRETVNPGVGNHSIWTVDLETGAMFPLTPPAALHSDGMPSWSPDGQRIAFIRWGNDTPTGGSFRSVMVMSSTGGPVTSILPLAHNYFQPGWSPDASQVIYGDWLDDNVTKGLFAVGADGSDPHMLVPGTNYPCASWR